MLHIYPCVGSFTCPALTLIQGTANLMSHPKDIQLEILGSPPGDRTRDLQHIRQVT